jgi:hypothetical protein
MGLYALLTLVYFALLLKIIGQGPESEPGAREHTQ